MKPTPLGANEHSRANRFGPASRGVYGSTVLEQGHAFVEARLGMKGHGCEVNRFEDQRRRAARRKEEFGGEKERTTAGMAERDAILPSSGFFFAIVGVFRCWKREQGGQLDSRVAF